MKNQLNHSLKCCSGFRNMIILLVLSSFILPSCRKQENITQDTNAKLSFHRDTVLFDTIFTSLGSTTKILKVLNKNKDAVNVSSIRLAGGASSPFVLNINGQSTAERNNLILNGLDSLNIFVKVTINPGTQNLPFLVQDSVILNTNGNRQVIQLLAYGQNAVFINNAGMINNTTWNKALPYVIYGTAIIKPGATLNIQPGAKVYFHKDAALQVEGVLNISGTYQEPIQLSSDRLDMIYSDEPGQWKGLYFKSGGNGTIENAVIKNASVGITSDSLSTNSKPKLTLSNSILKNMQVAAYIGYHSELLAFNNLVYNCGNYLIYAVGGGNFNFKQNTFAGINVGFPRKAAALTLSDYISPTAYNILNVDFANNIIWGNLSNELDIQRKASSPMQGSFKSNVIKTTATTYGANGNLINTDPLFISTALNNFELSNSSPALKKGIDLSSDPYFSTYLQKDLKNKSRIFPSSIGSYENY